MNHTSGLINNDRPFEPLRGQKAQIAYMLKHLKYDYTHTWDYQDVDYEILAAIISKQTHQSYNTYIRKNLLNRSIFTKLKIFLRFPKRNSATNGSNS